MASPAWGWSTVTDTNGDTWNVNDAAIPGLDTGSIHNTGTNSLQGYGGIRMHVIGSNSRLDGMLLRGFNETFDGTSAFASKDAVTLTGVAVKRSLTIDKATNVARFLDSFTNTTNAPVTIEVAFGGQVGYKTGTNQSAIASTSSSDPVLTTADSWVSFYTPSAAAGSASANGPSATVFGTIDRTGNFLRNPFANALATSGDESNHYGFVNRLTLPAGTTKSLLHFVVTGLSETRTPPLGGTAPGAGVQVAAVQATAATLAATPSVAGITNSDLCSIANFSLGTSCASAPAATPGLPVIAGDNAINATTSSPYNVVGKTASEEIADMKSGRTSSAQIVQAYLDRINAYDKGPFGLHSIITTAPDAIAQAKAADAARAAGDTRPLLGVPVLAKDIYDTKDMLTTGGSLVFEHYQPTKDAWLVAKLREAGAIIIGKSNLSEFANDGHFSSSAFGQVWNAFDPSKSSIGSSGGSAVAVASSFAAMALGTQTGDSLWGPSSAASLVSLRGTDGMQSTDGVMPLTYVQDYAGVIARSLPDLTLFLNATAIENPNDPLDDVANGHRPADWTAAINPNALQGKVIGVPATAFNDPFGTTGTSDAMRAEFAYFTAAGATVKAITDPPSGPASTAGDKGYEGWRQWILAHPDNPYTDAAQILRSPLRIPQFRNTSPYTGTGAMTPAQVAAFQKARADYRTALGAWMDAQGVDAVVFPGQLSDIHLNDSIQPSFGRLDPQASAAGVPTAIFPAGVNDHGQPINLQLEGREFSDLQMLSYAYAFETKANGHVESALTPALPYATATTGGIGGTVPATLSLTLGTPATFGAFVPGADRDYSATTAATVVSTAGDATLSVADPSATATGHLVNGTFSLPSPLLAAGSPLPAVVKTYGGPVSNDVATIPFTQHIGATDALRTGTYAKTLTFTLSTTNP